MIKQLLTLLVATCVLNLTFAAVVPAQAAIDDRHVRQVKIFVNNIGLGNSQKIKVKLTTHGGTVKGHITKINDENFVVTNSNGVDSTVAFKDVRDISRDHFPTWAIAVITVGAILGGVAICVAAGGCVE